MEFKSTRKTEVDTVAENFLEIQLSFAFLFVVLVKMEEKGYNKRIALQSDHNILINFSLVRGHF